MKRILIIIFFLSLLACSKGASSKDKVELEEDAEIKRDSLGYSQYYVHPQIREIKDLENLLRRADKVEAYNFNGNNGNSANVECDHLYIGPDRICNSATNKKTLTKNQINKLIQTTCDTTTYDGKWSGIAGVCYIPHMGFGFFEKDSRIAEVTVCFICSGIRTVPYYKSDGLTSKGAQRFIALANELGLKVLTGNSKLTY
jgi:hypothetical protein